MRKYLTQLHARPAHHRRRISMQLSAIVTIAVFLVWLSTLGLRLASSSAPAGQSSQTAAALTAVQSASEETSVDSSAYSN